MKKRAIIIAIVALNVIITVTAINAISKLPIELNNNDTEKIETNNTSEIIESEVFTDNTTQSDASEETSVTDTEAADITAADTEHNTVAEKNSSEIVSASDAFTEETVEIVISEEEAEINAWVSKNKIIPDVIPVFDPNSMEVFSAEEALKIFPYQTTFLPKYRDIYYWSPTFLFDLVEREEARKWYNKVVLPNIESNTEPQEMYTVSFVKYFKIAKEDFEKACEARKNWIKKLHDEYGHDVSGEGHEIHNADIIYTFDNEIINNYYLRKQIQTDSEDIK